MVRAKQPVCREESRIARPARNLSPSAIVNP